MGPLPEYRVKIGDARGAYTQSLLRGAETWVTLPENRWPKHWKGSFGGQWSDLFWHSTATPTKVVYARILSIEFKRLAEEWPGV